MIQGMNDLPAQHYLKIWQRRLSMAERGVTNPPPYLVPRMRQLVEGLTAVARATAVRLERHGNQMRFVAAETGAVLGDCPLFGLPSDDEL